MRLKNFTASYLYLLLLPIVLWFHYELLKTDALFERDDFLLIGAVKETASFADYFIKLIQGHYSDIQPVRDLTFFINIFFEKKFGYGAYHLANLILGSGILYQFRKALLKFGFEEILIFLAITFIAVHPLFNSLMGWVSNRKHLLSIFFMMLFINHQIAGGRGWKGFLWAFLSFLSQSITIFIPAGYFLYRRAFEKKALRISDVMILILTLLILLWNYFFYKYHSYFLARNFVSSIDTDFGVYLLRLGRVSTQILAPFNLAIEYDPGNILSLVGIVITMLAVVLALKFESRKQLFLYAIGLSTLFPVLNWGPRDPYLAGTLLVSGLIWVRLVRSFWRPAFITAFALYLMVLAFYSRKFTPLWLSYEESMKASYETEGGFANMSGYAMVLAKANPLNAYEVISEVFKKYPDGFFPDLLNERARALFYSSRSDEEKLRIFRKEEAPDIFALFYEARLLYRLGEPEKSLNAFKALTQTLKKSGSTEMFFKMICENPEHSEDCTKIKDLARTVKD